MVGAFVSPWWAGGKENDGAGARLAFGATEGKARAKAKAEADPCGMTARKTKAKAGAKERSRFPQGMTERKARAKADPPPEIRCPTRPPRRVRMGHPAGVCEFLMGGETWDEGASSMLVSPGINR